MLILSSQQPDNCSHCSPPVANLPLVSLIQVESCCRHLDTSGKFATGINNTCKTGGKICLRCRWYLWCTLTCEYLCENFFYKFETVLMGYSGAGGKLIHETNQKQKISLHCPLKGNLRGPLICIASLFTENCWSEVENLSFSIGLW